MSSQSQPCGAPKSAPPEAETSASFKLDTSGAVWVDPTDAPGICWIWADLSSFVQGYIKALFASAGEVVIRHSQIEERDEFDRGGFSDLSPEALALILRDCQRYEEQYAYAAGLTKGAGSRFYAMRQVGELAPVFPPLTVTLDDAGKVQLRAKAGTTERQPEPREESPSPKVTGDAS